MKLTKNRYSAIFLMLFALCSCGGSDSVSTTEPTTPSLPTTPTTTVPADVQITRSNSSESVKLMLNFINGETQVTQWTEEKRAPILRGAERWLRVLTGVQSNEDWELTIQLEIDPDFDSPAGASPVELKRTGENFYLPITAIAIFNPSAFSEHKELLPNIAIHELGHIFGIGPLWSLSKDGDRIVPGELTMGQLRDWYSNDSSVGGFILRKDVAPNVVREYNQVFNNSFDFIPVDNTGHFEVNDRESSDGKRIPSLEKDTMSSGSNTLSRVSVAMVEDFGWLVDYTQADPIDGDSARALDIKHIHTHRKQSNHSPSVHSTEMIDNIDQGGDIELVLNFRQPANIGFAHSFWQDSTKAPYIEAAKNWLAYVRYAGNVRDYSLTIDIEVRSLEQQKTPIIAAPSLNDMYLGDKPFPSRASLIVNQCFYQENNQHTCASDVSPELRVNSLIKAIEHGFAHILGIQTMWNLEKTDSPFNFNRLTGKGGLINELVKQGAGNTKLSYFGEFGVESYKKIFSVDVDHFLINIQEAIVAPDGQIVEGYQLGDFKAYGEASGKDLSAVSTAMLKDLGWVLFD